LVKESLIAIVDDDQAVRKSIGRLLRSLGFTAETFGSAASFLASPCLDQTDCLIADVNMPEMTGVELHGRLTDTGHTTPTILITAYPDETTRERAMNNGVICYLPKPFDEADLLLCVRQALERGGSDEMD
jgi:FixJ family two-component response regulator